MTAPSSADAPRDSLPVRSRIAGAPISWGVCEVPGWGFQLDAGRVLGEMRELGLTATEFGPDGFLEVEPDAKAKQLASYHLQAVGGFLPVLLHDPAHDPMPEVDAFIDACLATGAGVVVLAAFTGVDGYDDRPVLDDEGWSTLLGNLDRISDRAVERGVLAALHPHVGTLVGLPPRNFAKDVTSSRPTPTCSGYTSTPTRPIVRTSTWPGLSSVIRRPSRGSRGRHARRGQDPRPWARRPA